MGILHRLKIFQLSYRIGGAQSESGGKCLDLNIEPPLP